MLIFNKSEAIREVRLSLPCQNKGGSAAAPLFSHLLLNFNFSNPFGFVINEHKYFRILNFQISQFSQLIQFPILNFLKILRENFPL